MPSLRQSLSVRAATIAPSETSRACTPAIDCSGEPRTKNSENSPYAQLKYVPSKVAMEGDADEEEEPNSISPTVSPNQRGTKRKHRDFVHEAASQMAMDPVHHRDNKRLLVTGFIR